MALVKASYMAEPKSRDDEIYSASLMRATTKSHTTDMDQGVYKAFELLMQSTSSR